MKSLRNITVDDAKIILAIIRPTDDKRMHRVLRNDSDYLVFRTDNYMAEEIWFYKHSDTIAGTNQVFSIYHKKEEVNFDLIFLAYNKLIEMGYELKSLEINRHKYFKDGKI